MDTASMQDAFPYWLSGRYAGPLRFAATVNDWAASRLCLLLMGLSYTASTWA